MNSEKSETFEMWRDELERKARSIEEELYRELGEVGEDIQEEQGTEDEVFGSFERRTFDSSSFKEKIVFSYENDVNWVMIVEESRGGVESDREYFSVEYLNSFRNVVSRIIEIFSESEGFDEDSSFKSEVEEFESHVQEYRMSLTLDDVQYMINENKLDLLLLFLGTSEDYQKYIWKILNYKDEPEVEFLTKDNNRMALRCWNEYEGEKNLHGFVIGIDDTEDRFFIHRFQKTKNLEELSAEEWSDKIVRELMGFDQEITSSSNIKAELQSIGSRFRIQGDLRITVKDFLQHVQDNVFERLLLELKRNNEYTTEFEDVYHINVGATGIHINTSSTEKTKELQEEIGIPEEKVRAYQERDNIQALHNSRRKEYVKNIVQDRLIENHQNVYEEIKKEMTDTVEKFVLEVDNHIVIVDKCYTEFSSGQEEGGILLVPDNTNCLILHDEHQPKNLTLPEGAYLFNFLERNRAETILN